MRRQARALLADRVLADLDDDLLAFLQQVLDPGRRSGEELSRRLRGILVRRLGLVEPLGVDAPAGVLDVQERVAVRADVHERGLHPRQHVRDSAFVDVARLAAARGPLDEQLGDGVVLEDGDAGLERGAFDEDLPGHSVS